MAVDVRTHYYPYHRNEKYPRYALVDFRKVGDSLGKHKRLFLLSKRSTADSSTSALQTIFQLRSPVYNRLADVMECVAS